MVTVIREYVWANDDALNASRRMTVGNMVDGDENGNGEWGMGGGGQFYRQRCCVLNR